MSEVLGFLLGDAWQRRRSSRRALEQLESAGTVDSGLRVVSGKVAGLTREWTHGSWAVEPGKLSLFSTVVDDLLRARPAVLIVDEAEYKGAFYWRRFDYLEYFSRDRRFADFLRQYEPFSRVDAFRFYRRKADVRLTAGPPR